MQSKAIGEREQAQRLVSEPPHLQGHLSFLEPRIDAVQKTLTITSGNSEGMFDTGVTDAGPVVSLPAFSSAPHYTERIDSFT